MLCSVVFTVPNPPPVSITIDGILITFELCLAFPATGSALAATARRLREIGTTVWKSHQGNLPAPCPTLS